MAEEELISQKDVEALTAGLLGNAPGAPDESSLRPALKIISAESAKVVSSIVNKGADLPVTGLTGFDPSRESDTPVPDSICIKSGFASGLTGTLFFMLAKKDAGALADLMMLGDGSADYKPDNDEALCELLNQVMAAIGSALGAKFEVEPVVIPASAIPWDPSNPPPEMAGALQASARLSVETLRPLDIFLILSSNLVQGITDSSAQTENDDEALTSANPSARNLSGMENEGEKEGKPGSGKAGALLDPASQKGSSNIQMLMDIPLNVSIELGRTRLSIRKILELGPGSIIELDRMAGEPVDLLVNEKVVAKGEVVVVEEYFGIRILSLVSPEERIKHLQ